MPPQRATVSSTMPRHVVLVRDVGRDPDAVRERRGRLLGAREVGDHDARALGGEPLGDRAADPLRGAGDDGDLAVERAHQRIGEKDVGIRMRFCCVWISGWILPRNSFQPVVAPGARARRCSRSRVARVAPHAGVGRERADVRREHAEQVAEVAAAGARSPRSRRAATSSFSLPVDDVVVPLLDDHVRHRPCRGT